MSLHVKSLLQSLKVEIASFLGANLIRLLDSTIQWRMLESDSGIEKRTGPVIIIFWHDTQLLIFPLFKLIGRAKISKGLCALASRHADGRIIARISERLGFRSVLGSSTRGGVGALLSLVEEVENGYDVGVTPDGPKGPPYVLKEGVVKLAQMTSAPIYPLAYAPKSCWVFKSWDKMFLPKPFTKIVALLGTPIEIPKDLSKEDFKQAVRLVEESLRTVTGKVNSYEFD